ncbi:MAG: VWA domain-containing protein [Phototrophicaceae bacterium]
MLQLWGYRLTSQQYQQNRYLFLNLCLLLTLLVLASSQPTWGVEETTVELQGISVYILIDVSQSMLVEDVSPNRMEVAKLIALSLTQELSGQEVGLMLFSSVPSILFPLTTDSRSTRSFILSVEAETGRLAGTNYTDALGFALQSFNPETNTTRMIILISDGEVSDSAIDEITEKLVASQVIVHTIGIGTENGGMIPQKDRDGVIVGYKQDEGQVVISKLATEKLAHLAQETGGIFQLSNNNPNITTTLMNYIDGVETGELSIQQSMRPIERFYILVGMAIILFAMIGFRS